MQIYFIFSEACEGDDRSRLLVICNPEDLKPVCSSGRAEVVARFS